MKLLPGTNKKQLHLQKTFQSPYNDFGKGVD